MSFPLSFYVAAALLCGLTIELWRRRREPWALPALIAYLTVTAWYFVDPILYNDKYEVIPDYFLSISYWQVCLFLVAFRLLTSYFAARFVPRVSRELPGTGLDLKTLFFGSVIFWAVLLFFGVARMDWDLFGALFPLDARNGNLLWLRAAAGEAGPTGFLVSTAGYLYLTVCAFFGILLVLQRSLALKTAALGMMVVSWPSFLMSGTRNQFLAVCMPAVFTYALFGRQRLAIRVVMMLLVFLALDYSFKVVISHRNYGFRDILTGEQNGEIKSLEETQHEGLNMIQELCFINIYFYVEPHNPTMGMDYLGNLLNMVPRVLWPDKPLLGLDYAKWRGYGGGDSDLGVVATISSGLIGQGVLEFGGIFGPLAPATLMALWCGLLSRWWTQRRSLLRLALCMLGLGITFNLGRNISALIMWPVVFAYISVRLIEQALPSRLAAAGAVRGRKLLPQRAVLRAQSVRSTAGKS